MGREDEPFPGKGWPLTLLPRSLYGRSLLIIILPIAVMQIIVTYVFFTAHWDTVTARMSEGVAGEVALTVDLYREDPTAARAAELEEMLLRTSDLSVVLQRGDSLPDTTRSNVFSNLDRTLADALEERIDRPHWFDTTRYPNHIDIRVGVEEGVLRFIAAKERVFAPTGLAFVLLLLAATLALTLVSIVFTRNQAKPIVALAEAADAYGRGGDIAGFTPSGASEVRRAGHSFQRMQRRITRFIEQRTAMLAGVSHDLRTPLQRLKLHLALTDDGPEKDAARRDLAEMEAMLDGYLDFARSDSVEAGESLSIDQLVREACADFGVDADITAAGNLEGRPMALRRMLSNVVGNAVKYAPRQRVSLCRDDTHYIIRVEDDGPGIPADLRGTALRPFSRLDAARNQNVEGTGLGLSIARDIVRTHGGTLELGESELGGLCVEVRLPE